MISEKNPDKLIVSINDRDKKWFDLYELSISTGKLKKLFENKQRITGYNFDWNEKLRIVTRSNEDGSSDILKVGKHNQLTPIYKVNSDESAVILGWDQFNRKFYLATNKGKLDLLTLFLFDPITKKLTKVESDPFNKVDISSVYFDKSHHLIATSYYEGNIRYHWRSQWWKNLYNHLKKKFKGKDIAISSINKNNNNQFMVAVNDDNYIPEIYFYDTLKDKLYFQFTTNSQLKKVEKYLVKKQYIEYKSKDGLTIPAYLTLPFHHGKIGNLPTIIRVHGGPKGFRNVKGYDPVVQLLANRGYVVLEPNFRGSFGYGKKFASAANRQWGRLMQDDLEWGARYLIKAGISDKNKIAIIGSSYGGYAVLSSLSSHPNFFAAGIDVCGISNLFTFINTIPAYWEFSKKIWFDQIGDPNTKEGRTLLKDRSPLFKAAQITKPLLIVHGENDPIVKKQESDEIVNLLRKKGNQVTYLVAKDEGHGFVKNINIQALFAEIEKFLSLNLRGRYQKNTSNDIKVKLKELEFNGLQTKH